MTISIPFNELVAHVRARCPFYRASYVNLPDAPRLTDLPVVDRAAYWDAHQRDRQEVLTAPLGSGMVISSGGTTGVPKLAYHDHSDWDRGLMTTAMGFEHVGLRDDDRVVNMCAAGEMYGSFLGTTSSLKVMRGARVLQVPVSQLAPNPNVLRWLRRFQVNVIVSSPTRLLSLIDYLDREGARDVPINRLLFAGESFLPEQRAVAERFFPGVQIKSFGYASVDAGMMGYADDSCGPDVHRTINLAGTLEILDEDTHQPITAPGRPGYIVFTNLVRRLQPVIRYPSGDLGQWLDDPQTDDQGVSRDGSRYVLLGRAHEGLRMAFESFELSEFARVLRPFTQRFNLQQFQVLLDHVEGGRERLTLRLVGDVGADAVPAASEEIVEAFYRGYDEKPNLRRMVVNGVIAPIRVEWIGHDDLFLHERTGKLRTVVDLRRG